jgi:hypothetical protein
MNKQAILTDFREKFVEMHPSSGSDMHNRPLLYDANVKEVRALEHFISTLIEQVRNEERERILNLIKQEQDRLLEERERDKINGWPERKSIGIRLLAGLEIRKKILELKK